MNLQPVKLNESYRPIPAQWPKKHGLKLPAHQRSIAQQQAHDMHAAISGSL
jgi:hypothetical protein